MKINTVGLIILLFTASFSAQACYIGNLEFWVLSWLEFTHQYLAATCIVIALLYMFVKEKNVLAVACGLILILVTVALQYHEFFASAAKESCVMSHHYNSDGRNDIAVKGAALTLWVCAFLFFSETVNEIRRTLSKKKADYKDGERNE